LRLCVKKTHHLHPSNLVSREKINALIF